MEGHSPMRMPSDTQSFYETDENCVLAPSTSAVAQPSRPSQQRNSTFFEDICLPPLHRESWWQKVGTRTLRSFKV